MSEPKRVLDTNPLSREVTTWEYDDLTGKFVIETSANVGSQIDHNKRLQTDGTEGWVDPKKYWRKVASIPTVVAQMWLNQFGIDVLNPAHNAAMMRLLNSSDWRALRTALWNTGTHWKS